VVQAFLDTYRFVYDALKDNGFITEVEIKEEQLDKKSMNDPDNNTLHFEQFYPQMMKSLCIGN
jgi:hypothetical protein